MKRKVKMYAYIKDPVTGKRVAAHRRLAAQALGRPLLPREVVHHRNGESLDNSLSNLIVLPNQRVHAHVEFHARRVQTGMHPLFPELFRGIPSAQGTLFDHLLLWQGTESPKPQRPQRRAKETRPMQELTPLWAEEEESSADMKLLVSAPQSPGPHTLGELLACIQVQVRSEKRPLTASPRTSPKNRHPVPQRR